MSASDNRKFERYCKATMVGVAVPIIVSLLALIASVCTGNFSLDVWGSMVQFVAIGAIPGAVAGAIGAAAVRFGCAMGCGAAIFACVAGESFWFAGWGARPSGTDLWLFVSACVVGGLSGSAVQQSVGLHPLSVTSNT